MKLCTPAYLYVILSAFGIILIAFQNYGTSPNLYCVGNVKCPVQTTTPIFIMKILYVVFWTFILNTLCSYGYYQLSWFLLLLPFILFFIMVFILGTFLNKRTASYPGSSSSSTSSSSSNFGYNQAQPSQMNMMRQNSNNVQPPGSEQTQWFLQGNQNNTGGAAGSGGSKQYSSYGDYDGALDQRTNQIYNESHEKNQPTQHYK